MVAVFVDDTMNARREAKRRNYEKRQREIYICETFQGGIIIDKRFFLVVFRARQSQTKYTKPGQARPNQTKPSELRIYTKEIEWITRKFIEWQHSIMCVCVVRKWMPMWKKEEEEDEEKKEESSIRKAEPVCEIWENTHKNK